VSALQLLFPFTEALDRRDNGEVIPTMDEELGIVLDEDSSGRAREADATGDEK